MALAKGALSYQRFVVNGTIPDDYQERYIDALQAHAIKPIDSTSDRPESSGWVRWDDPLSDDLSTGPKILQGDLVLLHLRIDTLKVPPATLKAYIEHRVKRLLDQQSRDALTRMERAQVKADVSKDLRRRSLPKMTLVEAQWSMSTGELRLFATGKPQTAHFVDTFEKTFALKLEPIKTSHLLTARGMEPAALDGLSMIEPDPLHLFANPPAPAAAGSEDRA